MCSCPAWKPEAPCNHIIALPSHAVGSERGKNPLLLAGASQVSIPHGGLRTCFEELYDIVEQVESPSHPVGLEPMKTLKGGVAMRKPPSHTVGLEL